ncbi:MAG: DUF6088 family protein [Candidatus Dadabacteria bacterium]|nr:DUF6088 family protein [Candidatus Dadabacteria bacterium]
MSGISEQIMEYAETLPEGSLLCPRDFLDLGCRPAVHQAFSRLVRQDRLMRVFQGVYVRTIETRFGKCPPDFNKVITALSELWGEIIVPSGGGAANFLGLTTQVPMRLSYLTSGPSRQLQFYTKVNLRHAPRWQLVAPNRPVGTLIRALTFLHPDEVQEALDKVVPTFLEADIAELAAARAVLPKWIAEPLSPYVNHV